MGVQINPQNPTLAAPRRAAAELYPPAQANAQNVNTPEAPPIPKAGFGEGTASQATAAYVTLGRGLYSARQLVPTVEDLRAELRARLAETRARREEIERARDAREAAAEQGAETTVLAEAAAREPEEPAPPPEPAAPQPPEAPATPQLPPAEPAPPAAKEAPGTRLDLSA